VGAGVGLSALAFLTSAGGKAFGFAALLFSGVRARGLSASGSEASRPSTPSSRRYVAASATVSARDFRASLACDFSSIGNDTHYTEETMNAE
jgi:hypothetical protein